MATAKKATAKKAAPAKKAASKTATPAKKTSASAGSKAPAKKAGTPAKKRAPSAAFMKEMTVSPELAAVIGDKPMPRTEVTKKVWEYIKKNNLQDKEKKTMINPDAKLKGVIGNSPISMFGMTKEISKHLK